MQCQESKGGRETWRRLPAWSAQRAVPLALISGWKRPILHHPALATDAAQFAKGPLAELRNQSLAPQLCSLAQATSSGLGASEDR